MSLFRRSRVPKSAAAPGGFRAFFNYVFRPAHQAPPSTEQRMSNMERGLDAEGKERKSETREISDRVDSTNQEVSRLERDRQSQRLQEAEQRLENERSLPPSAPGPGHDGFH